ncbi:MAG: tyrosine-type recombinase/integrase [Methylocystis sp.]
MSQRLTDTIVKTLAAPATGNKIHYDVDLSGFGVRVTAAGARSFVLNYRVGVRERRLTIGRWPDWRVAAAREEARRLKRQIDVGEDPLADAEAERGAPTVADLCARFQSEHLLKRRPATQRDYSAIIRREILPALKHKRVAEVTHSDIDALHRKISKRAPYLANRVAAVCSRMFSLTIKWGWRADNPARGIERNQEDKRHRYLSPDELARLTEALAMLRDKQGANIIRLLLLTGARRGEALAARWQDMDLGAGVWTKPGAATKQKTLHRVPLSAPARQLLSDLRARAAEDAVFVFPADGATGHRAEIKKTWAACCKAAGLHDVRVHDLRHSFASYLASAGQSLPIIGALLGHSQPATTARYAHLLDDPLRRAADAAGATIQAALGGKTEGEVTPIKGRGRSR